MTVSMPPGNASPIARTTHVEFLQLHATDKEESPTKMKTEATLSFHKNVVRWVSGEMIFVLFESRNGTWPNIFEETVRDCVKVRNSTDDILKV